MRPDPYDMTEDESWWRQLDNDNAAQRHYQILMMQNILKQEKTDGHEEIRGEREQVPEGDRSPE